MKNMAVCIISILSVLGANSFASTDDPGIRIQKSPVQYDDYDVSKVTKHSLFVQFSYEFTQKDCNNASISGDFDPVRFPWELGPYSGLQGFVARLDVGVTEAGCALLPTPIKKIIHSKKFEIQPVAGIVEAKIWVPHNLAPSFSDTPGLSVTSISPNSGPTNGGTPITIHGTDFAAGHTDRVLVGGKLCEKVDVISNTTMTCITPSSSAPTMVSIVVIDDRQPNSVLINAYRYF